MNDGTELRGALSALEAVSDFAADRLCTDPAWDLVYCQIGLAILAIQGCTDELLVDLDGAVVEGPPAGVDTCVAWVEDAARVLQGVELGSRPGLAVAINAVADARAVLRDAAA